MRFVAILNRHGGAMRSLDLDAFTARMRQTLEAAGHTVDVRISKGPAVTRELKRAAEDDSVDAVIVGGGDGTVSAAAAALKDTGKALAILPAGTMNLFARSLGIPLDLDQAVAVFANGRERQVDVASANGRVFVHQFSLGMHAKMVSLREEFDFRTRVGKITASARAAIGAFLDPPLINLTLLVDAREMPTSTTGIGITNNLFGEGHLPYAAEPDGGALGIYITSARTRGQLGRFLLNIALGRWQRNAHVEIHQAKRAIIRLARPRRRRKMAAIDGELCDLDPETVFLIHPGALRVLAPALPPA